MRLNQSPLVIRNTLEKGATEPIALALLTRLPLALRLWRRYGCYRLCSGRYTCGSSTSTGIDGGVKELLPILIREHHALLCSVTLTALGASFNIFDCHCRCIGKWVSS